MVFLFIFQHLNSVFIILDLGEFFMKKGIFAFVNGQQWDMHRPLEEDCKLRFKFMTDEDPSVQNAVGIFGRMAKW